MEIKEEKLNFAYKLPKRCETSIAVLHHSAGEGSVRAVHRYHRGLGWSGIGYHFYVRQDGSVYRGRPEESIGTHTRGYNSFSIGVCAEGNFERRKMGKAQAESLRELCIYLRAKYPSIVLKLHRELDCTVCPGQNFPAEFIRGQNTGFKPKAKEPEVKMPLEDRRRKIREFQLWVNRQAGSERLVIDGIFGGRTEAALRAFQRLNGLKVDSLAGRESFYALCRK